MGRDGKLVFSEELGLLTGEFFKDSAPALLSRGTEASFRIDGAEEFFAWFPQFKGDLIGTSPTYQADARNYIFRLSARVRAFILREELVARAAEYGGARVEDFCLYRGGRTLADVVTHEDMFHADEETAAFLKERYISFLQRDETYEFFKRRFSSLDEKGRKTFLESLRPLLEDGAAVLSRERRRAAFGRGEIPAFAYLENLRELPYGEFCALVREYLPPRVCAELSRFGNYGETDERAEKALSEAVRLMETYLGKELAVPRGEDDRPTAMIVSDKLLKQAEKLSEKTEKI